MLKNIKKIFTLIKSEQAVLFSVLATGWSFIAGPLTIAIIGARFTPELQGYYVTSLSILGFSTYLQLGLGRVIIQYASNEWGKLDFDENGYVIGDAAAKSRLSNLAKFAVKWYLIVGLIVIIIIGGGGIVFLAKSKNALPQSVWLAPWISMAILCGLQIILTPFFYLLEGCNQVKYVYRFRFFQAVAGNVSIWIAVYSGAELWSYTVYFIVWLITSIAFLKIKYNNFFRSLFQIKSIKEKYNWINELLPLQLKIVGLAFATYFILQIFTQGSMFVRGPLRACQVGTTVTFIIMLGSVMGAFAGPKMPLYGTLIAQKKYKELDKQFFKIYILSALILILGGMAIWLGVWILNNWSFHLANYYAQRLLKPTPTALFIIAYVLWMLFIAQGYYFIAHRKVPHIWLALLAAALAVINMLVTGEKYGITGTAMGLIIINLVILPVMTIMVFYYRKKWHNNCE